MCPHFSFSSSEPEEVGTVERVRASSEALRLCYHLAVLLGLTESVNGLFDNGR
jgi:hypothetical protein